MLMQVFAIYDSGVDVWFPPLFVRSKGEVLRWWIEAVNDSTSKISKHPQEYCLFEMGTWDDAKNRFDLHKSPVSLGLAIEFLKKADLVNGRLESEGRQPPQQA